MTPEEKDRYDTECVDAAVDIFSRALCTACPYTTWEWIRDSTPKALRGVGIIIGRAIMETKAEKEFPRDFV